jgi:hypothetical protein
MSIHVVQLSRGLERRVARVDEPYLRLLTENVSSIYDLAHQAQSTPVPLAALIEANVSSTRLPYDDVYEGHSEWRLLPSVDHPRCVGRTLISGTGLTHLASVKRRDAMHATVQQETDSLRMYRWGVEGGKPEAGVPGTAPEWFYKGNGSILRAHGQPLEIPPFAESCGEEPEIAGVYYVDPDGVPCRIGMTIGNEFSDHRFEKRNYLYLAHSKLMPCAIGPEMVINAPFERVTGEVRVERNNYVIWSSDIRSGEEAMCHSLMNVEHHHFKYAQHRIPGDLHVHFFGADAFSFGDNVELAPGDVMHIAFDGFGRPLRNPVCRPEQQQVFWAARRL